MKKLGWIILCLAGTCGACLPIGRAYADSPQTPPAPPVPVTSAVQVASLPNPWPNGYIYYSVPAGPLGAVNLITPWSAAILAEGYDFIGHESITQGYVPLGQIWKITAVLGGGINGRGEGSPMGGGILDIVNATLSPNADFHLAVTGGYNLNEKHALAVLSGSVQFLK